MDAAERIVDFVNTLDVERNEDALATSTTWPPPLGDAAAWTATDRARLIRLREALRAELLAHHGGRHDPTAARTIEEVVAHYPLGISVDSSIRVDAPTRGPAGVIADLVDAMLVLVHTQRWHRVRVCPADDCLEAFYDSSRGGTRRWCSMGVCGNRTKVKTYRERGATTPRGADRSG